jgi:hypothetical protein
MLANTEISLLTRGDMRFTPATLGAARDLVPIGVANNNPIHILQSLISAKIDNKNAELK